MTAGSGIFSKMKDKIDHLVNPGGGLAGEIFDLRKDIATELGSVAGFVVEEFTNLVGAAAPGAAVLRVATATPLTPTTVLPAALLDAGKAMLLAHPRPLTFTTAGGTPADAPANVVITGTDQNGAVISETLALAQTATIVTSVKAYKTITSLVFPAADGAGAATIAIGIGAAWVYPTFATTQAARTIMGPELVQTSLAQAPRALIFTTAGGTPAHAPANVVITGKDINGNDLKETLALAQTATTATSTKMYAKIISLAFPAGDGVSATIAITFGVPVGLKRKLRARAGLTQPLKEIANGAVVTNGTFTLPTTTDLPNGSYSPNAAPNDANDYAIYYDADYSSI